MNIPSPKPRKERTENAEKRRAQLVDATLRSIAANGLAKTTLATVAAEAGLSQGVAVFYFKSKTALLTGALRALYDRYDATWREALARAGNDPVDRLAALVLADFDPEICNAETLSVWFAFWGEQKFTPQFAEVSAEYDAARGGAIRDICAELRPGADREEAARIADWIDTLTDGYWQHLHVFPEKNSREGAARAALELLATLLPEHADRLRR
ncbi:TetR family transcriptional regulator C-terminal domain-containing protein [Roseovarius sp. SCSIO 43702]|uniref:TetR family transcriptional regulator C-terminal domain-containing protein n=1 Tax=Roseovarius sp. SCSIO 43702 TaxID=2823043 RepID=UPI001C72BED1|nr:TetR family transcriptional regulator C-terminal domain-containing protein [Roseovarius sp. SCSIO 43702]QYX57529.1 TetR family transcriptional regulator C-terminal domain-containing protein [Roseovarius sp. SCSIO 43702]